MKTTARVTQITLLILLLGVPGLWADSLDNQVRKISDKLRCPTCQAQSVKDSDAGLSLNMKLKVRELLKEGKSEEEILDYFVDRYGEWILRSPKKHGFALLLWVLPGVILISGGLSLLLYMKKRTTVMAEREPTASAKPLSKEEQKKIDNALKNI